MPLSRSATVFLALVLPACGPSEDDLRVDSVLALEGDLTNGESRYYSLCANCHGARGEGRSGSTLAGVGLTPREVVESMITGPGTMPPYSDESDQTLADLSAFVLSL